MLTHWPQIVSYISRTGQQQEYQLVHGRVSDWSLVPWYDVKFSICCFELISYRDKHLMRKLLEMICLNRGWNCSKLSCKIMERLFVELPQLKGTRVSSCVGKCWISSTGFYVVSFHERVCLKRTVGMLCLCLSSLMLS